MRMEAVSLSNKEVVEAAKSFVPLRLATDRTQRLLAAFEIVEIPALVFLTPSGHFVTKLPPEQRLRPGDIARLMRDALGRTKQLIAKEKKLSAAVEKDPKSVDSLDALAKFMLEGKRYDDAYPRLQQAFGIVREAEGSDADKRLSHLLYLDLKLRRFEQARGTIEQFKQLFPKSQYRAKVEYYRGITAFYGGRSMARAIKIWEEQVNRHPTNSWSGRARNMLHKAEQMQRDAEKLGEDYPKQWRVPKKEK